MIKPLPRWIDKDFMNPSPMKGVLFYTVNKEVISGWVDNKGVYYQDDDYFDCDAAGYDTTIPKEDVTHWMYEPDAPDE